jgi:hypothetical protein
VESSLFLMTIMLERSGNIESFLDSVV